MALWQVNWTSWNCTCFNEWLFIGVCVRCDLLCGLIGIWSKLFKYSIPDTRHHSARCHNPLKPPFTSELVLRCLKEVSNTFELYVRPIEKEVFVHWFVLCGWIEFGYEGFNGLQVSQKSYMSPFTHSNHSPNHPHKTQTFKLTVHKQTNHCQLA